MLGGPTHRSVPRRTGVYMRIHEDSTGPAHRHGAMYKMCGMPISPRAPTFGAGAKIGDNAIAKKDA